MFVAQVSEEEEEDDLPRPQVKKKTRRTKAIVKEPNPDYLNDTMDEMDYNISVSNRRGKGGRSYYLKYAKEYLDTIRKVRSPLTVEGLACRYKRQNSDMEYLYKSGKISTLSPTSMTVEDIRAFIQYRWDTGVSYSEMMHEIASMKSLFGFIGSLPLDLEIPEICDLNGYALISKAFTVSWKTDSILISELIFCSSFLFFLSESSRPRRNGKETPYEILHRSEF